MKNTFTCFIFLLALSGLSSCATVRKGDTYEQEQHQKLVLARMLLEDNRLGAAKRILATIAEEREVAGVTDEALFRLALLNLEPGEKKILTGNAGKNLEKLLSLFPSSPWKSHAATLKGLLEAYDLSREENSELEKTIRSLKSSNLSLGKENKELRQDMEKLKQLDLELEKRKNR